jgi:hypothetical protein
MHPNFIATVRHHSYMMREGFFDGVKRGDNPISDDFTLAVAEAAGVTQAEAKDALAEIIAPASEAAFEIICEAEASTEAGGHELHKIGRTDDGKFWLLRPGKKVRELKTPWAIVKQFLNFYGGDGPRLCGVCKAGAIWDLAKQCKL